MLTDIYNKMMEDVSYKIPIRKCLSLKKDAKKYFSFYLDSKKFNRYD